MMVHVIHLDLVHDEQVFETEGQIQRDRATDSGTDRQRQKEGLGKEGNRQMHGTKTKTKADITTDSHRRRHTDRY